MDKSDSIKELAGALCKAQGAMTAARKDSNNPFYNSRYADLSAVIDALKEPLTDNGLSFVQLAGVDDENYVEVETVLMHISGEYISSRLRMKPQKSDPQGIGSCITYARRYGLQAMTGLPAEDDDGNAASTKKEQAEYGKAVDEQQKLTESAELTSLAIEAIRTIDSIPHLDNRKAAMTAEAKSATAKKSEWYNVKAKLTPEDWEAIEQALAEQRKKIKDILAGGDTSITPKALIAKGVKKAITQREIEAQAFSICQKTDLTKLDPSEMESLMDWLDGHSDALI